MGSQKHISLLKGFSSKEGWRLLSAENLWTWVVVQKHIAPNSVEDWIRRNTKSHIGGLVIWKAVVKSFDVIEDSLGWNIGNGRKMRVGEDPWVGCNQQHRLIRNLVESLRQR